MHCTFADLGSNKVSSSSSSSKLICHNYYYYVRYRWKSFWAHVSCCNAIPMKIKIIYLSIYLSIYLLIHISSMTPKHYPVKVAYMLCNLADKLAIILHFLQKNVVSGFFPFTSSVGVCMSTLRHSYGVSVILASLKTSVPETKISVIWQSTQDL